jgi:hypothetical protein
LPAQTYAGRHRSGKFAWLPAAAKVERRPTPPHIYRMSHRPSEPAIVTPEQPERKPANKPPLPKEIGGPKGPEPTRYGDWEYNGRCTDF